MRRSAVVESLRETEQDICGPAAPVAVAEVAHLGKDLALPVDAIAHLPPAPLADLSVQVEEVQALAIEDSIRKVVCVDLGMLSLLQCKFIESARCAFNVIRRSQPHAAQLTGLILTSLRS